MSVGPENCADVPTPSAPPTVPLPTKLETSPAGLIFRTRRLSPSTTYTLLTLNATPFGVFSAAAVPSPSAKEALPEPAKVVTRPIGEIILTRFPLKSLTYTFKDDGLTEIPNGPLKRAVAASPSPHPATPLPASVLTFQ